MSQRTHRLLVAILVLASVAVAPVAGAAAADVTRPADLVVRQESYVNEDVTVQTDNGTPVYSVRGERIWLRPSNFDPSTVVDAGIDRGAGELSYDEEMGAYTFTSEGEEASFTLYWIALEQVAVGGTNSSNTSVQRVRYEATVRVVGQAQLDHAEAGELEALRQDADNWRSINDTFQDVREMDLLLWTLARGGEPPSTEALIEGMINTYVTTRDPFRLLTGGFFQVIVLLTLSLGGLLYLAIREGWAAYVGRRMKKRLNIYRAAEAEEGELKENILEQDRQERLQIWSNLDFNDFGWSDHEAAAYRELGDTPREALEHLITDVLPPTLVVHDRLQAMAQQGFVARVLEREDAEDDDEPGDVLEAEVVRADDVDDDDDVEELDEPTLDLVDALSNDLVMIWDFNPAEAGIDLESFADPPTTFTLSEALEELQLPIDRFEDEQAAAKLLHEHVEWAADSKYTDEYGTPRSSQRVLNSFLSTSRWLADTQDLPTPRILAEHIEAMLLAHDPGREAEEFAREVRAGKHD